MADMALPDEALAIRAADGDERAFEALVGRHKVALHRLARRYVGNSDYADDIVQASFVSAWGALKRYDPTRSFAAWLRTIALNKCRDHGRRAVVRRLLMIAVAKNTVDMVADPQPGAEAELIAQEELATLNQAIVRLPRALKEPLLLTVFAGLSQVEAGRELGLSVKAVETRVYRARRALAEAIAKSEEPRGT